MSAQERCGDESPTYRKRGLWLCDRPAGHDGPHESTMGMEKRTWDAKGGDLIDQEEKAYTASRTAEARRIVEHGADDFSEYHLIDLLRDLLAEIDRFAESPD